MNRIDRLFGILTLLQSRKYVRRELLAEKFEISIRSVYRDIKSLGEIGIPVSYEPRKGYFIMQGYFLPPVNFSTDEANALMLMESIARAFGDRSVEQHTASALDKIRSVLRTPQKEKLEQLRSQTKVHQTIANKNDRMYLSEIQTAISEKNILRIEYQNGQGQKSNREIEPIGMTFYGGDWHLIAWCWKSNEYRDFKPSRILNLTNTRNSFRKSEHLNVEDYVKSLH